MIDLIDQHVHEVARACANQPRDVRAYLADVVDACDAIVDAVSEIDLDGYRRSRLASGRRARVHSYR